MNYGVDITFEQYMNHGFYYMVTASIFRSRYKTTLGERYSPVDLAASQTAHDAVYDETQPYTQSLSPAFISHLTATYRINCKKLSWEIFAKIINLTQYKDYYGHRYNWQTDDVEPEREATFMPNIGLKVQF